jgi:hypothetical protein
MPETNPPRYRIEVPSTGGIVVEAPTKDECLELYKEASKLPQKSRLDEAIR